MNTEQINDIVAPAYIKYQHVERIGTSEVEGIMDGTVSIFPKIDGTNAQIWFDGGYFHYGSRRREITAEDDNAGFAKAAAANPNLVECVRQIAQHAVHVGYVQHVKDVRVFGEWLVPHTLKTYREDAWREFYIFDVGLLTDKGMFHMPYDEYSKLIETTFVKYIAPIATLTNANEDVLYDWLEKNTYLIRDGAGIGEGIVIKNYNFTNKYGRQTWAKLVRTEFKEKHVATMGGAKVEYGDGVEKKIVDRYLEDGIISNKVVANMLVGLNANNDITTEKWHPSMIPQFLSTVYHDLVTECLWDATKKYKNPTINFKTLMRMCNAKVKELHPRLF